MKFLLGGYLRYFITLQSHWGGEGAAATRAWTSCGPPVGENGNAISFMMLRDFHEVVNISGPAIPILGLEHDEANHDGDQADGRHHQGKDNHRRWVAQLLRGTILEVAGVDLHKGLFHQRVGPWDH